MSAISTQEYRGVYLMDPETEDLIWGDELCDGMVVLIEDFLIGRGLSTSRDLESTRWCQVTKLRMRGNLIHFIGVYGDGSKFTRTYNQTFGRFVKRESLPAGE